MRVKVKLSEQELLKVAGGKDNKARDVSKLECHELTKKECKNEARCEWTNITVLDNCTVAGAI